jgi:predicted GIY-YIG superfamily endonuclease
MPLIYALKNRTSDDVYYGSTKQPLHKRLGHHKTDMMLHARGDKNYVSSFEVLKCPTAYIELCEEVIEENRKQRERWWVENNTCVNLRLPNRQAKEYVAEWRLRNPDYNRNYYNNRKALRNNTSSVDTSVQGV